MFNNIHRLFKFGSRSILPIFSLTCLNYYKKHIFHLVDEKTKQSQPNINTQSSKQIIIQQQNKKQTNQTNQSWNWQRIIQVNSPQQLSSQDIRKKVIVCYQMSGQQQVDSQVALIAHQFCDKYFNKISTPYQFVFLTPNPQSHQLYKQQQSIFVVFGRQDPKYISLRKYIKSQKSQKSINFIPNLNPLMKRLLQQVNQFQQLNITNLSQHIQLLNCTGRDTYQLLVIPQNESNKQIKKSKHILDLFLKNKQIWNSQIIKGIVSDQQTKIILGMNRNQVIKNKIYLIAPLNQNLLLKKQKNYNIFRIGNKKYCIINGEQIPYNFIFTPIPPKLSHSDYILKVNIDLNQTKPDFISGIYEYMKDKELQTIPKLLNYSKSSQPIEITIQKNNYDDIINTYTQNCMYSLQSKKQLLYSTNVWKYKHNQLNTEKLRQFVHIVTNNQGNIQSQAQKVQYQYYKSQPQTQTIRKNSKLIVGEERQKIIQQTNYNKVIFHYSKSCHSCKRFGGLYEQVARQQNQVQFYRIDNDTNKTQGLKNYNSTPVFVMYKKQYPNLEWYYKTPYFTKILFKNFVQITKQVGVMDSKKLSNHINQHINNQTLVKQTIKQLV